MKDWRVRPCVTNWYSLAVTFQDGEINRTESLSTQFALIEGKRVVAVFSSMDDACDALVAILMREGEKGTK